MKEKFWYTNEVQSNFLYFRKKSLIPIKQLPCLYYHGQDLDLELNDKILKEQKSKLRIWWQNL